MASTIQIRNCGRFTTMAQRMEGDEARKFGSRMTVRSAFAPSRESLIAAYLKRIGLMATPEPNAMVGSFSGPAQGVGPKTLHQAWPGCLVVLLFVRRAVETKHSSEAMALASQTPTQPSVETLLATS